MVALGFLRFHNGACEFGTRVATKRFQFVAIDGTAVVRRRRLLRDRRRRGNASLPRNVEETSNELEVLAVRPLARASQLQWTKRSWSSYIYKPC